jgi:NAD+ kinase
MTARPGVESIGLVLHPTRDVSGSVATVCAWASGHGAQVVGRAQDRKRLPAAVEVVPDAAFVDRVDGIVSLGGDGTMLGALRLVARRPVPVLGVNHGRLGFLVEVTPPALTDALERLAAGEFTVEHHGCLVADAEGAELTTRLAFNDVVLTRHGRTGTVSVDLAVGGLHYGYYRCDAVVVATPNGSTAYNYAAGGPVVSPSAAAVVVTPVAPMTGIDRAVVLGTGDRIALTVADDSIPVAVDVDGTDAGEAGAGDTVTVRFRADAAQVVRLSADDHERRSRIKLSLLDLPLRRDQLLELIPPELRRHAPPGSPQP